MNLLSTITTEFQPPAQYLHQNGAPQLQYPRPIPQAQDTFQGHRHAALNYSAWLTYEPCNARPYCCPGDYTKAYSEDHMAPFTLVNEIITAHQPYEVPERSELNRVQQGHIRGATQEPYDQAHLSGKKLDPVSPIQCESVSERSLPTGGYGYFLILAGLHKSVGYNLMHADENDL